MNIITAIPDLLRALKAGNELTDKLNWKKGQNLLNLCSLFVTGVVILLRLFFPDMMPINDDLLVDISSVLAGILALINKFITTATTKDLGFKNVTTSQV